MAPTIFEKAEADRTAIKDHLDFLETELVRHTTTPLTQSEVNDYKEETALNKKELMELHKIMRQSAPKALDMTNHVAEYNILLRLSSRLHSGFHGIQQSFPIPVVTVNPPPSCSSHHIKLPAMELPKFSGNLQEWVSFRDIFTNAVHHSKLTNVEKLTQLKALLTGEAARQVRSIILSDANYDIAWKSLEDRYENNRELLFSILKRLTNQQALTSSSATSLRSLIDTTKECVRQLEVLAIPTQHWDAFLLYLLFSKIDPSSRELWEQSLPDTTIPSLSKMYDFLEQRARALAASSTTVQRVQPKPQHQQPHVRAHHVATPNCKLGCSTGHPVFRCPQFQKQNPTQRSESIKRSNLCFNCLNDGHNSSTCPSQFRCKKCSRKHHTMLHLDGGQTQQQNGDQDNNQPPAVRNNHVYQNHGKLNVGVLATAKIQVQTSNGNHLIRSLVDGGATNCHITEHAARRMKLSLRPCNVPMSGLQDAPLGVAKYITSFAFCPHFNSMNTFNVTAIVVKSISKTMPSEILKTENWGHLTDLQLADPDFHKPGEVEILLGTDIFWGILENEKREGKSGQPFAVKSTIGWLVGGPNLASTPVTVFNVNADLDYNLRRFWEHETIPEEPKMTTEEQQCEDHFKQTHKRDTFGRYTVALPFKTSPTSLGSSRQAAVKRFISLERQYNSMQVRNIEKQRKLSLQWDEYKKFMLEYETLGHMSLVPTSEIQIQRPTYYIPHHCVFKESSTTTKLRVVFDASASSTNGLSLNECMMVGPQLQSSIFDIMLRFRCHVIAFTADIAKMYRQIKVTPEDTDLQRILWREAPTLPMREYRLNTVTYGTSSAPYLAVKCLQQLAKDEETRFPEASKVILNDFYVDDTASGCDTLESAKTTVQQLIDLCMSGGFDLRKWTTNNHSLLQFIPESIRETSSLIQLQPEETTVKTLGVYWNPATDKYNFILTLPPDMPGMYTKRSILSNIAKIFDPLGWLSPAIIVCKVFMQELWKTKLDWDEVLPEHLQNIWEQIKVSLKDIEKIEIPRCVISSSPHKTVIIGCSDASIKAISAVIYVYCEFAEQLPTCHMLTSKTKVAPVKHVTLPRLELNGSVLLAELMSTTLKAFHKQVDGVRAYTDSTITLHWIKSNPLRWKTYIKRRVQSIQDLVPNCEWSHIPGDRNPADCASRGISALELLKHHLWWNGDIEYFSTTPHAATDLIEEERKQLEVEEQKSSSFHVNLAQLHPIFMNYSSFIKLQRILSYVLRFLNNWVRPRTQCPQQKGPLTVSEISTTHNFILRQLQQSYFPNEYQAIQKRQQLPSSSPFLKLQPFISSDGLLRVGGRLRHAQISIAKKHPILLPKSHHITTTIILDAHHHNFHAGPAATLAILQQRYWIVNGRDTIRHVLKKCVTCTRFRAEMMQQVMGDLPFHRVNPSRPFSKVGVDYAGPVTIKPMVRSKVTLKCWLAIFVCFTTRAIHIEIVSSLSTECFLAAFRRFISRRGKPTDVFSDCGTNFRGADKVLRDFFILSRQAAIQDECSKQQINWHFNPAGAPHFGGLWEAGVKSIKYHLVRVLGSSIPTYEEMYTLIVQIEGILNSRPLIPASTDPSDLGVLTPAHFLIGDSLAAIPEPVQEEKPTNLNKRWNIIQYQQQQFWKRWMNEFITRLQQRPKWMKQREELNVGALVIVKDERLPPLKWKLARVIAVHPGPDGHVRVATLKTEEREITRPIAKLCLLPISKPE